MSAERAILSIPWGPQAGLKVALEPGKRLRVGRTERAELVISTDDQLSAVHFELAWDGAAGRVRDLRGEKGVRVGGEPVTEAAVGDRTWIRAGATDFMLRIEGASEAGLDDDGRDGELPEDADTAHPGGRPRAPSDPDTRVAHHFAQRARENERTEREGVAAQLARISREERLYAVLDVARNERILELLATSADTSRSLYEGAQGDGMAEMAPHLVRFDPGSRLLRRLVLSGWGARWGIFLTSAQPFKDVRRHLRRFLMVEDDRTGEELYFRFYDPDVLRVFLPTCLPGQARELWSDVTAFLFEDEHGELVRRDRADALAFAEEKAR
jgi:hypothetical protein